MGTVLSRLTTRLLVVALATVVGLPTFASAPAWAAPPAQITDLGVLPGDTGSAAFGINATGQVVGGSGSPNGASHAFLYSGGSMAALGALSGDDNSEAVAINSGGEAVGSSWNSATPDHPHAVVFANGSSYDLGTLDGSSGCNSSFASAVNDAGDVVGTSALAVAGLDCSSSQEAFLYRNGVMTDLGHLPGDTSSNASGINNLGQAVGSSWACDPTTGCVFHAVLFSGGTVTDIGSLPGSAGDSSAFAINDGGQIVGFSGHPFLYSNGVMTDLGTLPQGLMDPFAINGAAHVVGGMPGGGPDTTLAGFFWSASSGMVDLQSFAKKNSGWQLIIAYGINDSDQVVGGGVDNGQDRAYLLTVPNKYRK